MADASRYILEFVNPEIASLRVPIYLNDNGEIAIEGDTIAGAKNITFTYTKYDATAQELYQGSNDTYSDSTTGIITTFVNYLLGGSTDRLSIKRTIVQTTRETDPTIPPTPEPTPDV